MNCETCGAPYTRVVYVFNEPVLLCDYASCETEAIANITKLLLTQTPQSEDESNGNIF